MRILNKRVDALERGRAEGFKAYRCIRQYEDQSDADAVTLYEQDHGPVDIDNENLLYVIVRKPFPSPVAA